MIHTQISIEHRVFIDQLAFATLPADRKPKNRLSMLYQAYSLVIVTDIDEQVFTGDESGVPNSFEINRSATIAFVVKAVRLVTIS